MQAVAEAGRPARAWQGRRASAKRGLLDAVNKGDIEVARTLLQTTNPDAERDADGRTALAIAVLRADLPLVKLLLASGADRRAVDRFGHTPVSYASASTDATMLQASREALKRKACARSCRRPTTHGCAPACLTWRHPSAAYPVKPSCCRSALGFAPGTGRLYVATAPGLAPLVADLRTKAWAARACLLAGRKLTAEEWRRYVIHDRLYRSACGVHNG